MLIATATVTIQRAAGRPRWKSISRPASQFSSTLASSSAVILVFHDE